VCLDSYPSDCFSFSVYDSAKFEDGMTGGDGGSYELYYGGDRIAAYDSDRDGCYAEKWYEFGDGCGGPLSEGTVGGEACEDDDGAVDPAFGGQGGGGGGCSDITFTIDVDEFPEDVAYTLVDTAGNVIWDESDPWNQMDQYGTFKVKDCIPDGACYIFTITDSPRFKDGLTKGDTPGRFTIKYGGYKASYDAETDGCYLEKWYQFGDACPEREGTTGTCQTT